MDNKKLNEAESLELISLMIRNARTNLRARINCNTILAWGYTVVSISLLMWIMKKYELFLYSSFLWLLIPAIGYFAMRYFSSEDTTPIKSYLDKIIDYISILFISVGSTVGLSAILVYFPVLFIEGIIFNIWIIIIGLLIKYKPVIWGGIIGLIISHCLIIIPDIVSQILVFATIPVFSIIIPGHLFKNSISKNV